MNHEWMSVTDSSNLGNCPLPQEKATRDGPFLSLWIGMSGAVAAMSSAGEATLGWREVGATWTIGDHWGPL